MTNSQLTSNEHEQRLKQIRERSESKRRVAEKFEWARVGVQEWADIDFLLSLLDSQAADGDTRSRATVAAPQGDAFTAYNQAIEDAKAAIRGEKVDDPYAAATFINVIARKCSPHVYVTQLTNASPTITPSTTERDLAYADGYNDGLRQGKQSRAPAPQGDASRKLTLPELNHLSALLEAERESGSYAGPREQYYARTERLIKWCNDQIGDK